MGIANQHYMTEQERYKLEGYLQAGKSVTWIASQLGCTRKTIYNEIHRGTANGKDKTRYSAAEGQAVQDQRSKNKGCSQKLDADSALLAYLEKKMLGVQEDGSTDSRKRFSPAAALAAARRDGMEVTISISTLYNYIDQGIFRSIRNTDLLEKSRRKPRKKRKKPKIANENLPSIEQRPKEINERSEIGHWEMDLIVGPKGSKPCLLTLTERTTREEIIIKLPDKRAKTVRKAFNKLERNTPNFKEKFKSITTDNGSEFLEYDKLKKSILDSGDRFQIYYCHSCSAWEKGSNENHNRIIRRWFPKGTDFSKVTKKEVKECQDWMNSYPRKILNWKSPLRAAKRGPRGATLDAGSPLISITFLCVYAANAAMDEQQNSYLIPVILATQQFQILKAYRLVHKTSAKIARLQKYRSSKTPYPLQTNKRAEKEQPKKEPGRFLFRKHHNNSETENAKPFCIQYTDDNNHASTYRPYRFSAKSV